MPSSASVSANATPRGPRRVGAAAGRTWANGDSSTLSEEFSPRISPSQNGFKQGLDSDNTMADLDGNLSVTRRQNPRSARSPSPGSDAFPLHSPDLQHQDYQKSSAAAQWWLSEAKRMREEALKMRKERDRFRLAVEDAHFECRRLSAQVYEFQAQLRQTQQALRESKSMADAARRELERLRHWIEDAHAESRRLNTEVQEYEWQLRETKVTLDEAERSCQELKVENEEKQLEIVQLKGDRQGGKTTQQAVVEAQEEAQILRIELDASKGEIEEWRQNFEDARKQSERLDSELKRLKADVTKKDQEGNEPDGNDSDASSDQF